MKVILVNGSPHPKGCTYTALQQVSDILTEKDIEPIHFWIGAQAIGGCTGCNKCKDTGLCVFGGVVNTFLEQSDEYDGYVFGTPVHLGTSSGNMKCFMDRVFHAEFTSGKRRLALKPAAAVSSARRAGDVFTLAQLNNYFSLVQMPIVTSRYWNSVHGLEAKEVDEDKEGMQVMRFLGRNMAWLLKCLEAGREKGIAHPNEEDFIYTHFIRRCE